MARWREGFHQKGITFFLLLYIFLKICINKMYFHGVFKVDWSFLMSCSLKVTQYMYQPASQLYGISMSVLKFL